MYVLLLNKILTVLFLLALKSNGDDRPRFTEVKPKALRATAESGKVVTFEAVTAGQKPIGEYITQCTNVSQLEFKTKLKIQPFVRAGVLNFVTCIRQKKE